MTTLKKLKSIIQENIDREQVGINLFYKLLSVIEKMEGQQITKRLETAFNKAFPEYETHYDTRFSMFHLEIWGNGIEYVNKESFLLGYFSDPIIRAGEDRKQHSGFRYYSCCSGKAAEERNERRKTLLADKKRLQSLARLIDRLKKASDEFHGLYGEVEDHYAIQKAFELPDHRARN